MKTLLYIALLCTAFLNIGCEDTVHVDLDTAPSRLVIDAQLDWQKGTDGSQQTIKLSMTTGYYEYLYPAVSGAEVTVTNSSNTVFTFTETPGTGNYVCNDFVPVIGEKYTLTIQTGGQTYTASETLIGVPEIDYVNQSNEGGFEGDEIEVKYYFNDNGAEDNFYMTSAIAPVLPYPDYDVWDDEFTQGNQNFGYFSHEDLTPGQQLKLTLYGISEPYMNYMNILLQAASGDGGPWQTTPANVRGNIVNQTNKTNFALGYFRLSEVDRLEYTIQ
ncbi:DUF4249 domain-containing protein [Flavobacterium sp.]|uniref:DUF4249 domain-containing protein n=1 Tax=Flavobacterium sp. TaxID=239 RepID=UPI0039E67461